MKNKKFFSILISVSMVMVMVLLWKTPAAYAQEPGVVFLSPQADGVWSGQLEIKIQLENIDPEKVRVVTLYLDGRLLKEFEFPPYVMTHEFGIEGQDRSLKVVVQGKDLKVLASAEIKSYRVDKSYEVEVRQVMVPVVVKDKNGNYVRGLKKEDFLLLSDDAPMEISYLSTQGTERFNMAQVIDISYSMRDKIHDVLLAGKDFYRELLTGNDRGTFVFFNQMVFEHTGFTGDVGELIGRLDLRAPVMGGTALYDAVAYTLNLMGNKPGWNIVVIFSDGDDNSSYIDRYSLVKKVKNSPVVIYAIDNKVQGSNDVLGEICSLSGGMLFPLRDMEKTGKVYEKIREEIKAQYVIYFNPGGGGGGGFKRFHSLVVKVKDHEYDIRTIDGYYY